MQFVVTHLYTHETSIDLGMYIKGQIEQISIQKSRGPLVQFLRPRFFLNKQLVYLLKEVNKSSCVAILVYNFVSNTTFISQRSRMLFRNKHVVKHYFVCCRTKYISKGLTAYIMTCRIWDQTWNEKISLFIALLLCFILSFIHLHLHSLYEL